jgi:tRNA nucleotidyltransferase (CCA-adding enzyme)
LTGQDFATRFSAYLKAQQSSQQQQDRNHQNKVEKPFELGKIATIEARPDQSKHLETATTTFLGLDLDFVQLRSEEYGDQDSRIPSNVVRFLLVQRKKFLIEVLNTSGFRTRNGWGYHY